MGLENYEVLPVEAQDVQIVQVDSVERANVDSQVATAKQYPRSIKRCVDNSIVMAMHFLVAVNPLLALLFTLQRLLFPTGGI